MEIHFKQFSKLEIPILMLFPSWCAPNQTFGFMCSGLGLVFPNEYRFSKEFQFISFRSPRIIRFFLWLHSIQYANIFNYVVFFIVSRPFGWLLFSLQVYRQCWISVEINETVGKFHGQLYIPLHKLFEIYW